MKSKQTKRALISSALALVLCFVMLLGTTFAWFTDNASTSVNKVQAGKLRIALLDEKGKSLEGTKLFWQKAQNHENEAVLWEPGASYDLQSVTIKNEGNLALKYKIEITGIDGDAKLNEAIEWTIKDSGNTTTATAESEEPTVKEGVADYVGHLKAGEAHTLTISGKMKTDAGNTYQGLSIEGAAITVYATQDTVEYDSTTDQYDKDATLPTVSSSQGEINSALNGDAKVVNLALGAGTYTLPTITNKTVTITGNTDTVIDLQNVAMGAGGLDITFDGVTVKFANENYKGLQHATKVTYRNCVLTGKQFLYAEEVEFENCTFVNESDYAVWTYGAGTVDFESCTFYSGGKAILIYTEDKTHTNNVTVNNCVFYDSGATKEENGDDVQKAAIEIGDAQPTAGLHVNLTATNNTIYGFSTGENTTTKVYGNKNSIPAERLVVTASNNTEYDKTTGTAHVGGDVNLTGSEKVAYVANATVTAGVTDKRNRIYSDDATFVNCTFKGEDALWFKDAATFIDCTFNCPIYDAEPVEGTIKFENCTFNESVHFAPASTTASNDKKFLVAEGCEFNAGFTVEGFEKVTLKNCYLSGNNWASKNMISYCSLDIDGCVFTKGIRLAQGMTANDVSCTNGTVELDLGGSSSATVGETSN